MCVYIYIYIYMYILWGAQPGTVHSELGTMRLPLPVSKMTLAGSDNSHSALCVSLCACRVFVALWVMLVVVCVYVVVLLSTNMLIRCSVPAKRTTLNGCGGVPSDMVPTPGNNTSNANSNNNNNNSNNSSTTTNNGNNETCVNRAYTWSPLEDSRL